MAFPLDLVPAKFFLIFYYLPFKFVYFFPIQVAQGRLSSMELYKGLALLLFWCILLYFVSKLMWKRGLKKYGAYGN